MTSYLLDNPLLLLFLVVAIGYPLGKLKVRGTSLGVATVLFAGLAVGATDEALRLPQITYQLGLVLFVYTIGIASGRGFVASLRRNGLRDGAVVVGIVGLAALITGLMASLLDLAPAMAAGVFAGSLTNTPALAAELEYLKGAFGGPELEAILADPVVGYSVAYPFGVLGVIAAIVLAQLVWRIDYRREAERAQATDEGAPRPIDNRAILVSAALDGDPTILQLVERHGWNVVFGRLRRGEHVELASSDTRLRKGDIVSVVGAPDDLESVARVLGEAVDVHLEHDRRELDFRRIFVSSQQVSGRRLRDLHLPRRYGAVVTRIRRGDQEFLPKGDTVLLPGDRVRVVAPRASMQAISAYLGDSYRAVSEVDIPTFSIGIALGLLLGTVPIPLPGGLDIQLGLAGGPLLVALVLGALERTGPLNWSLPYSASMTLRQLGLVLFLAGIGVSAGYTFVSTIGDGAGVRLLITGAVVTFTTAMATILVAYRVLRIPMGVVAGYVAGVHTQPAVLGFALEQSRDELPNLGYAAIFPIATIAKIIIAQVLLGVLL